MTLNVARLAVALALAALLSACGFHPLYGSDPADGGARQVFASIYVDPIAGERIGYELRNSLIDGLNGAAKPTVAAYRLKVTVDQYLQGIAVQNNATVTRYNYTLNATYELSDIRTNQVVKTGVQRTLSAYDVVQSPYATLVAQEDAQKRGASDIAYRIRLDLSAYFANRNRAEK
jgi:LPS-assembly lipoprotein